jgi:hypothetical protein
MFSKGNPSSKIVQSHFKAIALPQSNFLKHGAVLSFDLRLRSTRFVYRKCVCLIFQEADVPIAAEDLVLQLCLDSLVCSAEYQNNTIKQGTEYFSLIFRCVIYKGSTTFHPILLHHVTLNLKVRVNKFLFL